MIDILDYLLYLCRDLGINYKISDELDISYDDECAGHCPVR